MIIGIGFVVIWIWCIIEAMNTPITPEENDNKPKIKDHIELWADDPDVQEFLEQADKQGPWPKEHDKSFTIGGLSADKDKDFIKFQKKQNKFKK